MQNGTAIGEPLSIDERKAPEEPVQSGWRSSGTALITPIGLVEGDVLLFLERHGTSTLRQLARTLKWPARLVIMAVGALIRQGLVMGMQHDMEVVLRPAADELVDEDKEDWE